MKWMFVFLGACFQEIQAPIDRCVLGPNQQPFTSSAPGPIEGTFAALPDSFQFGTATAAFQIESNVDLSDWSLWTKASGRIRNGDLPTSGPDAERHLSEDIQRMRDLGTDSYRFGIELSRLFPTKASLLADPPEPDAAALLYYDQVLRELVRAGIRPMVTVQHFSLPAWLENGVLADDLVPVLTRYAGFLAERYGDSVDYWITINEPSGLATGGFIEGSFPPGHVLDVKGFSAAYAAMAEAHARMYDAIVGADREDADGDNVLALVSFATHNRLWLPLQADSEQDVAAAKRLRYISNLVLVEAAACGNYDANFDETLDGNDRVNDPRLKDRLDFIALNYYGIAGVGAVSFEPFRGVPVLDFPASPRPKSDLGWDIAAEGLLPVLAELGSYRLPVIITENGVADSADVIRPRFLVDSVLSVQAARAEGYDVRGYYHWSLMDNFEWALGLCPRFGLYSVDGSDPQKNRTARSSVDVYRQLIAARGATDALRSAFSYGSPGTCSK